MYLIGEFVSDQSCKYGLLSRGHFWYTLIAETLVGSFSTCREREIKCIVGADEVIYK